MINLALPALLAFSTLVFAAPPQARSGAINDVATATTACSSPKETTSPSDDDQEQPTQCLQARVNFKQGDAPWGNGLPPAITISPGLPFFLDRDACSTNSKLLTKMEDEFMKSVSKSRKNKQKFDNNRPTFAVIGGACVMSDFKGYADGMPRYQSFANNNAPSAPAAPTGWNGPNNAQPWQPPPPRQTYQNQPWGQPDPQPQWGQSAPQPQWGQSAPQSQWGQPAPQSQWGQPAPQSQWGQPAPQSQWGQPVHSQQAQPPPFPQQGQPYQWQPQSAQNQPQYPPGDRGWQPYTTTVTVSYPSQSQNQQNQPQNQPQDQWQPDPSDNGFKE